ncbi:type II toxin-antitoxin system HipA family toxin [Azospirillum sp. YIM B02556]|uniref:Type II toxin-antitoxin system HipA family toxin n=1 Tax=Azospirillum endophyticum TaxID=2800326 RepID=A0ABS1FFG5_9PROT|nr:type II toxin-antitoxin system HipA family toxin [Azospirillum endophyticum]MBK1842171.1 type II toxin-antitoxin system HipA family toxin [Azospirillum endophyticum]
MSRKAEMLGVYLEPAARASVRVGSLLLDSKQSVRFVVDQGYIDLGPERPILSAAWWFPGDEERTVARLSDTRDKTGLLGLLPAWFRNVLPEGALRVAVERQMGPGIHTDFDIMKRVGHDLPGAVVVRDEGYAPPARVADHTADDLPPIRFGLAGVQMKLSVLKEGEGLTVPAEGQYGSIIAKLPSRQRGLEFLPELEFSAMRLAAAAGVTVAACELIPLGKLRGIGPEHRKHGEHALAVTRFDRASGARVHIEDFAQIFGAVDNQKYTIANEETLWNGIKRFAADPNGDLLEAVRRFTVNVLLGNGDAHLKNTSLIYPDGGTAHLSPAYDIVPTFCLDGDDTLAIPLGRAKTMADVTLETFRRPGMLLSLDPRLLTDEAKRTVERAADEWPALLPNLPLVKSHAEKLRGRWEAVALAEGHRQVFLSGFGASRSS